MSATERDHRWPHIAELLARSESQIMLGQVAPIEGAAVATADHGATANGRCSGWSSCPASGRSTDSCRVVVRRCVGAAVLDRDCFATRMPLYFRAIECP